jgi:hypothetical protein
MKKLLIILFVLFFSIKTFSQERGRIDEVTAGSNWVGGENIYVKHRLHIEFKEPFSVLYNPNIRYYYFINRGSSDYYSISQLLKLKPEEVIYEVHGNYEIIDPESRENKRNLLTDYATFSIRNGTTNQLLFEYKGNWKKGEPNGFGKLYVHSSLSKVLSGYFFSDVTYEGQFEEGYINKGKLILPNNFILDNIKLNKGGRDLSFESNDYITYNSNSPSIVNTNSNCNTIKFKGSFTFRESVFNPQNGEYVFCDGTKLIGDMDCCGGTLVFPNGEELKSEFRNGKLEKIVSITKPITKTLKTESGCDYNCEKCEAKSISWTGKCPNGIISGKGILELYGYDGEKISRFDGILTNSKKNGIGTLTNKDGSTYTGNFINNEIKGNGTWITPDKYKYIGQFSNGNYNGSGLTYYPSGKIRKKGIFKEDELISGTGYFEDGTVEYTVSGGVKKLSSAAEKIAKLETQLENNRTDSNNSRIQNNRNQEEQARQAKENQKENWRNSSCFVTEIDEKEWEKTILGNNEQLLHYVTIIIPKSEVNEYDTRTGRLYHFHQTKGVFDEEKYYWEVREPSGVYAKFNSKNDALKEMTKAYGCKSWSFK